MGEMRILSAEGDTKVIWDHENDDEVEAAEAQFDTLREKGFKCFRVDKKGEKTGGAISRFPKTAGKLIMVPVVRGG